MARTTCSFSPRAILIVRWSTRLLLVPGPTRIATRLPRPFPPNRGAASGVQNAVLTTTELDLIRSSFQQVLPIADRAGILVYERIFTLAPGARSLFDDEIPAQGKRLMAATKNVVDSLDDLDAVTAFLVKLGARHVRYGVQPAHFDVVEEALLWTLEQGLGDAFTSDVRAAWKTAWTVIADAMLLGMRTATRERDAVTAAA